MALGSRPTRRNKIKFSLWQDFVSFHFHKTRSVQGCRNLCSSRGGVPKPQGQGKLLEADFQELHSLTKITLKKKNPKKLWKFVVFVYSAQDKPLRCSAAHFGEVIQTLLWNSRPQTHNSWPLPPPNTHTLHARTQATYASLTPDRWAIHCSGIDWWGKRGLVYTHKKIHKGCSSWTPSTKSDWLVGETKATQKDPTASSVCTCCTTTLPKIPQKGEFQSMLSRCGEYAILSLPFLPRLCFIFAQLKRIYPSNAAFWQTSVLTLCWDVNHLEVRKLTWVGTSSPQRNGQLWELIQLYWLNGSEINSII